MINKHCCIIQVLYRLYTIELQPLRVSIWGEHNYTASMGLMFKGAPNNNAHALLWNALKSHYLIKTGLLQTT